MANIIEAKSTFMSVFTRSIWGMFGKATDMVDNFVAENSVDNPRSKKESKEIRQERELKKSPVGFWNLITRWHIIIDLNNKLITIKKRNWYLIGHQEDVYAFKSVRHVQVKNHLFGADIGIRMFSGNAIAYSISKSKASEIRKILLNPEWNKMDADVVVDIES